jgi:hypothetical protein
MSTHQAYFGFTRSAQSCPVVGLSSSKFVAPELNPRHCRTAPPALPVLLGRMGIQKCLNEARL